MLNSDISDTETQPQPDVERESMSSASSTLSMDIKTTELKCDTKTTSPICEGLLKIASPLPPLPDANKGQVTPQPSPPPSPGPPVLEPMTSLVPTSFTSASTTVTPASSTVLCTSAPSISAQAVPKMSVMTTPALTQSSSISLPTTTAPAAAPQLAPAGGSNPIQQIILPPVQAGQQQQFILQPQQLAAAGQPVLGQSSTGQPLLTTQPSTAPSIVTQQPSQQIVQIIQGGLPLQYNTGPIPLLNPQGQFMATVGGVTNQAQLVSNLQNFVMMIQPTLPTVNQSITPAMSNPIIIKQEPNTNQSQLRPLLSSQPLAPANNQLISIAPAPNNVAQPSFVTNPVSQTTPLKLGQPLPTTPMISAQPNFNVIQNSNGQSFNIIQPQLPTTPSQQQPQAILQTSTPNLFSTPNILQPQSNAMNILANNTNQVTTTSNINVLSSTPQLQQQSNVISIPQTPTTVASNPATVQLVQDPNTGLYNLVQSQQPQQLVTHQTAINQAINNNLTPINPALTKATESPKRSATPIVAKGTTPSKVPKLMLPTLPATKENKPDPPVKQFMCGVCNKYFGNQKNLRVHISEIHEGKRGQFPCDICHKVFPRKRNMERHKNALHLKNSPQCYLCHKSVVNLEMHIKRFHKSSTEIKIKQETAT